MRRAGKTRVNVEETEINRCAGKRVSRGDGMSRSGSLTEVNRLSQIKVHSSSAHIYLNTSISILLLLTCHPTNQVIAAVLYTLINICKDSPQKPIGGGTT